MLPNAAPQPPRAAGIRYETESSSRGWLQVLVGQSLALELRQCLPQGRNDTNSPTLLKKLHRQPLKPTLRHVMQPLNLAIRLRKANHAALSNLLREELQAHLDLLHAVELKSEPTHPNEINRIPLQRRCAPVLLRRNSRQTRTIEHLIAMPLRVVCL